jgi:tetratricopeptide (TPR) repeat protein
VAADDRSDPDAGRYNITVSDSRGVYVGDHGIQVNLFTGEPPRGPVVAGNVPQAPSAFLPRADLMAGLRTAGPGVSVVRAVTGMRGVGKTQLAAAYARDCIDAGWRLVAWVDAEDTPATLNGLAVVAARLGIDRPNTALETIGGEVRNRLEADGDRCLIVFDNVTNPDELRPYLPAAGQAQVVITSTDTTTSGLGTPMSVDVFTQQESLAFLAGRTGRGDPGSVTQLDGAKHLAEELGHLPLALAQAAAVIAAQHLTYRVYLDRLRAYPTEKYLPRSKGDPYPRGVAEAIGLSIDAATHADPTGLAGDLLDLMSLLSTQGVARALLYRGPSADIFTAPPAIDEAAIDEAIGRLADASLLTFGGEDTVIVHRLTMRSVRERAERSGTGFLLAAKACMLLDAARAAQGEPRLNRAEVRVFAQHVVALNANIASGPAYYASGAAETKALGVRMLSLRVWALAFLNLAGDAVTQAVGIAEPLLADCEASFGESHAGTLSVRNNLGAAYRAAGRLDDAIKQYERVLADRERLYGRDDPDTLTCRNNLGAVYHQAGRTAESIELLERTVADRERILGADHPETLTSRNNLASAYAGAGRLSEAVREQLRSVADRERVLGTDHPDTLRSRANLAAVLQDSGRSDDAVALYQRVVADCERVLGDQHPETLIARCGLARSHHQTGRLAEAIAHYEQALPGLERGLGASHPAMLTARADLDRARHQAAKQADTSALLGHRPRRPQPQRLPGGLGAPVPPPPPTPAPSGRFRRARPPAAPNPSAFRPVLAAPVSHLPHHQCLPGGVGAPVSHIPPAPAPSYQF